MTEYMETSLQEKELLLFAYIQQDTVHKSAEIKNILTIRHNKKVNII